MVAEPTGGCLDPDVVIDYVEGRASPELRDAVERHASGCSSCRKTLSLLARSRAPTGPSGTPTGVVLPGPLKLSPGHAIGRYVVRELLGAGGMGEVYVADDPELGREVAIKLVTPALGDSAAREVFEARFRREARALARISHPNVVAVYDVGRVEDRMFIAMQLVEGETIASWCRSERRSARDVLEHFIAAGRGLAAAHAAGIVHRDVKPANLMLGNDGRVRVVDFGLSRAPHDDGDLTRAGSVLGTPHYMAPEQHRGEDVDARTDQFAFCVALYWALYGQFPFDGATPGALARAVMIGEPREPPRRSDVSRRVWTALRRGMSASRGARFATLDELLGELAPAPPQRRAWVAAAIGVAVAATAVAAIAAVAAQSTSALATAGGAPVDAPVAPGDAAMATAPRSPDASPPPVVDAGPPEAEPEIDSVAPDAAPIHHGTHHVHAAKPPPIDRGD
jgi:serine/threonine protein kinase|nr:protein kinase [Kofleriaceae bacterium]